jgi:DNA-binding transcriptional ArsR family regulator
VPQIIDDRNPLEDAGIKNDARTGSAASDSATVAMAANAAGAARMLKAMAHETRLLILCCLAESELTVGELNARVPVSQSVLSQHLAVLRRDRLVQTRRSATTIHYRLQGGKPQRMISVLYELFCDGAELE